MSKRRSFLSVVLGVAFAVALPGLLRAQPGGGPGKQGAPSASA